MTTTEIEVVARALKELLQAIELCPRYGGRVAEEEWWGDSYKYVIVRNYFPKDGLKVLKVTNTALPLSFHTREQAEVFMKDFESTIKRYYMFNH